MGQERSGSETDSMGQVQNQTSDSRFCTSRFLAGPHMLGQNGSEVCVQNISRYIRVRSRKLRIPLEEVLWEQHVHEGVEFEDEASDLQM